MINNFMDDISVVDPDIHNVLVNELNRGRVGLEMIASENYVSKAILQTNGSVLTNKYSEGFPGKRYYGGNEFIDVAESLAIERAKELFDVEFANVQPHSGSQANMEAYYALLNLGDTVLSMQLDHGGHLTHGHKVSFSGKFYDFQFYGVDEESHILNMDDVMKRAKEVKPKLILTGYSAYPREIDFKGFQEVAQEVDAILMADIAHIAGLVAGKEHMSPSPYCDVITTTTHKTLRGPRGAMIMGKAEYEMPVQKAVFPGMQGGPMDMIVAGKAVCFKEALNPNFKEYAKNIKKNASALADSLLENGARLISGGTDNHLILMDISPYAVGGKDAEKALDSVGIFTNKNMIPFDKRSPFDPSGIRVGTAALTTRGLGTNEMNEIGELMVKTIKNINDSNIMDEIKSSVRQICNKYPLYPGFELLR